MDRRAFFKALMQGALVLPFVPAIGLTKTYKQQVLIQESPIAGFQYYDGDEVFAELWVDTPLLLQRELSNKYDRNAVAIYYKQFKLGFVPKAENTAVAQMLDRGEYLSARVVELTMNKNPWERVRFGVTLDG